MKKTKAVKEKINVFEVYEIESGIPVPATSFRQKTESPKVGWQELAKRMKIGDSVLLSSKVEADTLQIQLNRLKCHATQRLVQDSGQVRVWRIRKKS